MTFTPSIVTDTTDTDADLPLLDLRLRPGAVVPAGRLAAGLIVSIEAVSGSAAVALEGYDFDLVAGEAIDLREDADPAVWNTGDDVAHLVVALRLPAGRPRHAVADLMAGVEAFANLGSRRDTAGSTGDGLVRYALGTELGDEADLVRNAVSPEQVLRYAA